MQANNELESTLKQRLVECEQKCGALELRSAKSAFIDYFRASYLSGLEQWEKDFEAKGSLTKALADPKTRKAELCPANDAELEAAFKAENFAQSINPEDQFNQKAIDDLFEKIDGFLSDKKLNNDRRNKAVKPASDFLTLLLKHQFKFLDLAARDSAEKTRLFLESITDSTTLEQQDLADYLIDLKQCIHRAYAAGSRFQNLVPKSEQTYSEKIISESGCMKTAPSFAESTAQYINYIRKNEEHFRHFREEFVAHAKLEKEEKHVPDAQYPYAFDDTIERPLASVQRYSNVACLVKTIMDTELAGLAGVKEICEAFTGFKYQVQCFLGRIRLSMTEMGTKFCTVDDNQLYNAYLESKAWDECLVAVSRMVKGDPILTQICGDFETRIKEKNDEAFAKLLARVAKIRDEISGEIAKVLSNATPDSLQKATTFCSERLAKLEVICVDSMLEHLLLLEQKELAQKKCQENLRNLLGRRLSASEGLARELGAASEVETLEGLRGVVEKVKAGIKAEKALVEPLKALFGLFEFEYEEKYGADLENLEKRCADIDGQVNLAVPRKEELKKIRDAISKCKAEEVAKHYEAYKNFLMSYSPQKSKGTFDIQGIDDESVMAVFMRDVVQKLGIEETGACLAKHFEKPLEELDKILEEFFKSTVITTTARKDGQVHNYYKLSNSTPTALVVESHVEMCRNRLQILNGMGLSQMCQDGVPAVKTLLEQRQANFHQYLNIMLGLFVRSLGDNLKILSDSLLSETPNLDLILDLAELIAKNPEGLENAKKLCTAMKKLCDTLGYEASFQEYDQLLAKLDYAREAPKKIIEMNQRLIIIASNVKGCDEELYLKLLTSFREEERNLNNVKYITRKQTKLDICLAELKTMGLVFEDKYRVSLEKYHGMVMQTLNALEKNPSHEQIEGLVQVAAIEKGYYDRAVQCEFALSEETKAANLTERQAKLTKILQGRLEKLCSAVKLESKALDDRTIQANRKIIEDEKSFAQGGEIVEVTEVVERDEEQGIDISRTVEEAKQVQGINSVCDCWELSDVYGLYRQAVEDIDIELTDHEKEKEFFSVVAEMNQFKGRDLRDLNETDQSSYFTIFNRLDQIIQERLALQARSSRPRNLDACFSAYQKFIPAFQQEVGEVMSVVFNFRAEASTRLDGEGGFRATQTANFLTKMNEAVAAGKYDVAEKLIPVLNPVGSALPQCWALLSAQIIFNLPINGTMSDDQDRQRIAIGLLHRALTALSKCKIEERLEFYDALLGYLLKGDRTEYLVTLHALVFLLRTAEDSNNSSHHWRFTNHTRTAHIAGILNKPLDIMITMNRFVKGEAVNQETSMVNWIRKHIQFIMAHVQAEITTPTPETKEGAVMFFNNTNYHHQELQPRLSVLPCVAPPPQVVSPAMFWDAPQSSSHPLPISNLIEGGRSPFWEPPQSPSQPGAAVPPPVSSPMGGPVSPVKRPVGGARPVKIAHNPAAPATAPASAPVKRPVKIPLQQAPGYAAPQHGNNGVTFWSQPQSAQVQQDGFVARNGAYNNNYQDQGSGDGTNTNSMAANFFGAYYGKK